MLGPSVIRLTLSHAKCPILTLLLSETWFHSDLSKAKVQMPGFHDPIRRDRDYNSWGGVAIYVRQHLTCIQRSDLHVDKLEAVVTRLAN